ncbi:hypothetical protein ACFYZH_31950 [Streptomyces abikoensis]|uniref:hypothetical protein n=1 Tax=Streptomyces abikoensis TaxID=97398 RepID=UPI0036A441C6
MFTTDPDEEDTGREVDLVPLTDQPLTPPHEGADISILLPRHPEGPDGLPARYGALD